LRSSQKLWLYWASIALDGQPALWLFDTLFDADHHPALHDEVDWFERILVGQVLAGSGLK
jgi:hypothetical protein